ncbi:MAG: hypothetical protein ACRC33_18350, partial [Gemmataceae bacterium]
MNVVQLQERIAQADPAAVLVPPRVLRRVIRADRQVATLRVPHRHLHLITRDRLLPLASADELGLPPGRELPPQVLLLPVPADLATAADDQLLLRYSRLLFHGEAHRAFDRLALTDGDIADRVGRLGRAEFAEARDVLTQEALLYDGGDRAVYEEFAALYHDLRAFAPGRLAAVFPSCLDRDRVEAVFRADLDADAIAARTRLPGAAAALAAEPVPVEAHADDADHLPSEKLEAVAEDATRAGNLVRAAILQRRAGVPSTHVEQLVTRLLRDLGMGDRDRADWHACLTALLEPAARGYWNVEARLLYDLQKVCLDVEKPLFAADLAEWIVTLGRRPVKRPLPDLPLVLAVTHIRTAEKRLGKARIDEPTRERLAELLQSAEDHLEERMRQTLRPKVADALDAAGLVAANAAERLSRGRLVEELLDRVVAIGALTLGDLRDAVARSRLKLGDLRGPGEFLAGDPLLKANENLARGLDGIARRGEFYLRWMQGLSSLFFGTAAGRALTLYALLPVLASFFALKGADALIAEVGHVVHWVSHVGHDRTPAGDDRDLTPDHAHAKKPDVLFNGYSFAGMAAFFLLLFHVRPFRRAVGDLLYWLLWVPLRAAFYDVPRAVATFGPLRAVLASRPFQLFMRFVGRPALLTVPLLLALYVAAYLGFAVRGRALGAVVGGWFLLMVLVLNTRWGLALEERVSEGLGRAWELFHQDFLLGVWGFFVWLFRAIGDRLDRWRYSVDERLRFRQGDAPSSFAWKAGVGLGWFAVVYAVRMVVILFVEPQVNPIKHFPVVTVSHKLSLLAIEPVSTATGVHAGYVAAFLGLIPGVFGFLAWELKENWRLYRANESPTIDPEMVGSHGEHVINYVRPGFHSGTLPRAFSRLRRARGAAAHRAEEPLHHVEHELRRFVGRELTAPLAAHAAVEAGAVRLATNRVRVELLAPALGPPAWLEFENEDGQLAAGFVTPGWTAGLDGV